MYVCMYVCVYVCTMCLPYVCCRSEAPFLLPPRILGSLLSAHLLIKDPDEPFGKITPAHYDGELLNMAKDLANRLLPAFHDTATGIPHPRVCRSKVEGQKRSLLLDYLVCVT